MDAGARTLNLSHVNLSTLGYTCPTNNAQLFLLPWRWLNKHIICLPGLVTLSLECHCWESVSPMGGHPQTKTQNICFEHQRNSFSPRITMPWSKTFICHWTQNLAYNYKVIAAKQSTNLWIVTYIISSGGLWSPSACQIRNNVWTSFIM